MGGEQQNRYIEGQKFFFQAIHRLLFGKGISALQRKKLVWMAKILGSHQPSHCEFCQQKFHEKGSNLIKNGWAKDRGKPTLHYENSHSVVPFFIEKDEAAIEKGERLLQER